MKDPEDWTASVEVVGILGGGTIGASWSALFLAAGYEVHLYDPSDNIENYVRDYVKHAWPSLEALELTTNGDPQRIRFFNEPQQAVAGAQFIQENVPERIEIKHELFRRIEASLTPEAIISSSSSGLLLSEMQQGWKNPEQLILGHPFNPPHLIPLVELLANEKTGTNVLDRAESFYKRCGKVTIRVNKEVPAHVANRLQAALWRESIHLVAEGVVSVEDLDKAISAGPGLRWSVMGPHMLFNLASGGHGMDVFCERFGDSFHRWWDDLGSPRLTPEIAKMLSQGVKDEAGDRNFAALAHERDAKIIEVLRAINRVEKQLENEDGSKHERAVTAR